MDDNWNRLLWEGEEEMSDWRNLGHMKQVNTGLGLGYWWRYCHCYEMA